MAEVSEERSVTHLTRCQNKANRVNLKHKRKKNLIKKAIELDKVFDMDVLIVLKDRDTGKFSIFESGNDQMGQFSLEKAAQEIESLKASTKQMIKKFDHNDYTDLNKWPLTKQAVQTKEAHTKSHTRKRAKLMHDGMEASIQSLDMKVNAQQNLA